MSDIDIETVRYRIEGTKRKYKSERVEAFITIVEGKFSRDVYGNSTAHYRAYLRYEISNEEGTPRNFLSKDLICSTGIRREQVGYLGRINESALVKLEDLGFELDTENPKGVETEEIRSTEKIRQRIYRITNL